MNWLNKNKGITLLLYLDLVVHISAHAQEYVKNIDTKPYLRQTFINIAEEKPLFNLEGPTVAAAQPKPHEHRFSDFLVTFLEISGVIAVSALVGYQLWDLVA